MGIDIGGTFTDFVLGAGKGAELFFKVPTTPNDQTEGVIEGMHALDCPPGEAGRIVHGTTVGTNALLERRGSRVGLATTGGFGDLLEIGRTQRLVADSMFDPGFIRPKPLVPRHLRFEVNERTLASGDVSQRIDPAELETVAAAMERAQVESVAVCFLHAYRNAANEAAAGQFLRQRLSAIPLSLSSEVVTEHREFERFSSTVVNAYLAPVMLRYLNSLETDFRRTGYRQRLFVMNSAGGMISAATARSFPIRTILSGPAGGVNGAIHFARQAGLHSIITCDMGGTSTDVCLVQDLVPLVSQEHQLAGVPIKTAQMEINTVGAGGGSIARIGADMRLKVGPQSAGADPGPAAYGRGGLLPTITDANLLLGRLGTRSLLAGRLELYPEPAEEAFRRLSGKLGGYDLFKLAEGIIQIAVTRMAGSIKEVSVQKGFDPRDFVLVAFGGCGPMHAAQLGEELGIATVLIPPVPGNLSALGLIVSDVRHDDVEHHMAALAETDPAKLEKKFAQMEDKALALLCSEGFAREKISFKREVDLRYRGQGFELTVPVARGDSAQEIAADFVGQFRSRYGHLHPEQPLELVNLRLASFGAVDKPEFAPHASEGGSLLQARKDEKEVFFGGKFWATSIFSRGLLPSRQTLQGPAVIEENGATTVIPPGWSAEIDAGGNILLNRRRMP